MSASAQVGSAAVPRSSRWPLRRVAFVLGLLCALAVPHVESSAFTFPAVDHVWSLAPFAVLLVLPFIELSRPRARTQWQLLLLAAFAVPLALEGPPRQWPVVLVSPLLAAVFAVMLLTARGRPSERADWLRDTPLPRRWMLTGIAVLALVHVNWALQSHVSSDVAEGGVRGAHRILDGRPIYGGRAAGGFDPHTDTYGPLDYEAYVPFVAIASDRVGSHEATLFFDLLTALLLFVLGRRMAGEALGVALAYCWLAFPLTLYEDALGFNDALVAAAMVGVVLAGARPARRGAAAALAALTKLVPLVLLPLLLADTASRNPQARARALALFAVAFAIVAAVGFAPVLAHGSLHEFAVRTFGFQAGRSPSESLWAALANAGSDWVRTAGKLAHGLLVALAGGVVLLLWRVPRRGDDVGLAAACAAVLVAVEACLSYFSYSYILWFAPLALVAILGRDALARGTASEERAPAGGAV